MNHEARVVKPQTVHTNPTCWGFDSRISHLIPSHPLLQTYVRSYVLPPLCGYLKLKSSMHFNLNPNGKYWIIKEAVFCDFSTVPSRHNAFDQLDFVPIQGTLPLGCDGPLVGPCFLAVTGADKRHRAPN